MSTNYYSYAPMTAEDFFNTVVMNAINRAKEKGETRAHFTIWNLTVPAYELKKIAEQKGMRMRKSGRSHRSYDIYF